MRADGTRTTWSYKYCSGTAGGTASCPIGGSYLVQTKALGSDRTTQIAPTATAHGGMTGRVLAFILMPKNGKETPDREALFFQPQAA